MGNVYLDFVSWFLNRNKKIMGQNKRKERKKTELLCIEET